MHPRDRKGRWRKKGIGGIGTDYLNPHTGHVDEDAAVTKYVDGSNGAVNNRLRAQGAGESVEPDPELDGLVAGMDAAIQNKGVDVSSGPLYRGIDVGDLPALAKILHNGGAFKEASFTSTTGALQVAKNFADHRLNPVDPVVLAIHTPPGTKALPYSTLDEAERILPRGGTFKVRETHPWTQYGRTVLWADVDWAPANA
jgi:hypothetical protein